LRCRRGVRETPSGSCASVETEGVDGFVGLTLAVRLFGQCRVGKRHSTPWSSGEPSRKSALRGVTEGALVGEAAVLLAGRIRSPTAGAAPVPGPVLTLRMAARRFPVSPVHC